MIIDKLTKAYLQIGSGLTLEDAQRLAKTELEMRLQFQKDWQAGKVARECRLFRQSMKRQRDAAAAYYAENPEEICRQVATRARPCTDFKGKNFASLRDLCKFYEIALSTYRARIADGWDQKRALLTKKNNFFAPKKCRDHTGREFASISDMCKAWKIGVSTFKNRMRSGYELERALTEPPRGRRS